LSGWRAELVEVRPSQLHGKGVFALTDIPAGTRWWSIGLDEAITVSRTQFAALVQSASSPATDGFMSGLQEYCIYLEAHDVMVLIPDNGRYVNHSDEPNSAASVNGRVLYSVTVRDIAAGEEITEDYATYDECSWPGLAPEYNKIPVSPQPAGALR
jgi:hypothetical protein